MRIYDQHMEKIFLQLFLETGLFDIGDNDTRLENLEASIKDLQDKLNKDPKLLPTYTLVALDPQVPQNEQALIDTETIVTGYWKALRTKYSDRPIHILRGVILNALYNLGISDPKLARVINLTASNLYPYVELNKEAAIFQKFLTELSDLAEKNAIESWALIDEEQSLKIPTLKISGLKFGDVKVDQTTLEAGLLKAIQNETVSNYGTANGGNTPWGTHFAKTSSTTIAASISKAASSLGASLSPDTIEAPINKFISDFKKSLDVVLKASFSSINAVEQRSKLLWWKETLYSTSLKTGYRTLDISLQPILMAYDLYILLPALVPVSVDYLLMDTLRLVNPKLDDEISFFDYLTAIDNSELKEVYKPYFTDKIDNGGRVSITDFITLLAHNKVKVQDLYLRTGIDLKRNTSITYFTTAILHDLMATFLTK